MSLGTSTERLWPGGLAIVLSAALAGLLLFVSRGVNRPPVISRVETQPPRVPVGGSAVVRVAASDPDGDRLTFEFSADSGTVDVPDQSRPGEAMYWPSPQGSDEDRVTVKVKDAGGLSTSTSRPVAIERPVVIPTATPSPFPETPEPARTTAPTPARTAAPTPPPTPSPAATRTAAAGPNHPPVLTGGQLILEVQESMVGLEATGSDPDGDPITHSWDFGGCLRSESVGVNRADVQLKPGCSDAIAVLTWTDSHGAQASTEWTITR